MSGLIGGILKEAFEPEYELTALNRRDVPGVACFQADISDLKAIRPAFEDQDFVIHLAAKSALEYTWEEILYPNVIGTYNVFEAARQANVERVIFASSGSITTGWELEEPYKAIVQGRYEDVPPTWPMVTHESQPRPFGLYGCSKLWGEGLAWHYAHTSDLSIICVRIGEVLEENRPTNTRRFSMWCSHRDLIQMMTLCISAPDDLRFDVFYAVSDNEWSYRDVSHAREIVGYKPEDQAESFR